MHRSNFVQRAIVEFSQVACLLSLEQLALDCPSLAEDIANELIRSAPALLGAAGRRDRVDLGASARHAEAAVHPEDNHGPVISVDDRIRSSTTAEVFR
jgi:hypothetical protein